MSSTAAPAETWYYFVVGDVKERILPQKTDDRREPVKIYEGCATLVCNSHHRTNNIPYSEANVADATFTSVGNTTFRELLGQHRIHPSDLNRADFDWSDADYAAAVEKDAKNEPWALPGIRVAWKRKVRFVWGVKEEQIEVGKIIATRGDTHARLEAFVVKDSGKVVVKSPTLNFSNGKDSGKSHLYACDGTFILKNTTVEDLTGVCARSEIPVPPTSGAHFVGRLTGPRAMEKVTTVSAFGSGTPTARLNGRVQFCERRADGTYEKRTIEDVSFANDLSTDTFPFAPPPAKKSVAAVLVPKERHPAWDVLTRSIALIDGMCIETYISINTLKDRDATARSPASTNLEWVRFMLEKFPADGNLGNAVMPINGDDFNAIYASTMLTGAQGTKTPRFENTPPNNDFALFRDAPFHFCPSVPVQPNILHGLIESKAVSAFIVPVAKDGDHVPEVAEAAKTPIRTMEQFNAFFEANKYDKNTNPEGILHPDNRAFLLLVPNSTGEWERVWNVFMRKRAASAATAAPAAPAPAETPAPASKRLIRQ